MPVRLDRSPNFLGMDPASDVVAKMAEVMTHATVRRRGCSGRNNVIRARSAEKMVQAHVDHCK